MLPLIRRPNLLFTGLREPLDRINSDLGYNERLYNYLGKTFDVSSYISWVRNPTCNFLVQRFPRVAGTEGSLMERAMRVLECFHFVYFPETFSELCNKVTQTLNLPPVTKNENVTPSPKKFDVDAANFTADIALYEEAYKKWGPDSPIRGAAKVDEILSALCQAPSNLEVLRKFYYNVTYLEYKHWNVLDQVIDARTALIGELKAELEVYEKLRANVRLEVKPSSKEGEEIAPAVSVGKAIK